MSGKMDSLSVISLASVVMWVIFLVSGVKISPNLPDSNNGGG